MHPTRLLSRPVVFVGGLLGLLPWVSCPGQIADDPTAVPVHFQGMFDAQPTGDPDQPASVRIFPLGVSVAAGAAAADSPGGTAQLTSGGFARLRPGKVYWFEADTHALTRLRVKVTPPSHHRIFINGVEHEMFDWAMGDGGPLDPQGYFTVRLDDGSGAPVGEASSLRPGRVLWSVGLGNLRNGKPAGQLRLVDDGLTANAFRPAGLYFDRDGANQNGCYSGEDGEVIVVKVGGVLRQVYATGVLADLVALSDHAYLIRLYPREAVGARDALDVFAVSGTPLFEFRVENPTHPALDTLRISKTTYQNRALTVWTQLTRQPGQPAGTSQWLVDDWVEAPAGASAVNSPVRHRWTYSDNDRNELFEVLDAAGTVAQRTLKRYVDLNFGVETARELESEISGYGGPAPIQTSFTYHTDFAAAGSWRKIKSVVGNDGSWTGIDYHDDFRRRGQVRQIRRPHRNSPAADPGLDAPGGEVTTYSYGYIDNFGTQCRPTRIETKTDGIVTARSDFSYTEETVIDRSAVYSSPEYAVLPVLVTERRDYASATQALVTRIRTYREDADPQYRFFPGLLRSIERPDQTMTVAAYFNVSFMQGGDPFFATPGGGARAHVVLQGTCDLQAAPAAGSYQIQAQPLPANFRIVSGKSRLSRVLIGENALALLTEQQAYVGDWVVTAQDWSTYLSSLWPATTQRRTAADGPTWSIADRTWDAGRLVALVDDVGNRQTYTYDSLGRVASITHEGATANGDTIAARTTVHAYDAVGRLQTRSLTAGGESLTTATEYDTAGRIIAESAPGQAATRHTFNLPDRVTTTTLPSGATRVATRLLDGRVASMEGTAEVAEYTSYELEPDGRKKVTTRWRGPTDVRRREQWTDWLHRPVQTATPGFSNRFTFLEVMGYDPLTGQLNSVARTGYADRRYEYNRVGEVIRSGLDLNGLGLDPVSTDRITDTDESVEWLAGALWVTQRTWAFPQHRSDARLPLGCTRQRLTGLSPTLRGEIRTRDAEDNESIRTVTVDAARKMVTTTTTTPGLAGPSIEVVFAGFAVSSTGPAGLVYRQAYDALGRLSRIIEPRTGTAAVASITYHPNTTLPHERRDASNRLLSRTVYDQAARPVFWQDADNRTRRVDYNSRDQMLHHWGSATYPVAYTYDAYGQRVQQRTYRDPAGTVPNSWETAAWPGDGLPAQITEWEFDDGSGMLKRKYDAERRSVDYDYNLRGQIQQRLWARTRNGQRVATNYDYFPGTGELRAITYSDGTPAVSFQAPQGESYSRLGQPLAIEDATGRRQLDYDAASPWRLAAEVLPAFYGRRKVAGSYESATTTNAGSAGYAGHVLGTVKGRLVGYRIGTDLSASPAELEVLHSLSNTSRHAGLVTRRSGGSSRQFAYSYEPIPAGPTVPLVRSVSALGTPFLATRTYEAARDLVTRSDTLWNGATQARHDFVYNAVREREAATQTGEAFADLGATHQRFTYSPRGELTSARWYAGADPAGTTNPLPGRCHDYTYDAIGNRQSANTSGSDPLRDDYLANDSNQYTQRENNTLAVTGTVTANPAARVAVTGPGPLPATGGQVLAGRAGTFWGTHLAVENQHAPFLGSISTHAVLPGAGTGGADLVRSESRIGFLPTGIQTFTYDDDGNLTSDGVWTYTWDAENRLTSMIATAAAIAVGRPPLTLVFGYDYRHRRIKKEVRTGASFTLLSERRYLYDGWNVIAEFDGATALKRSFTWGLDLNGAVGGAGGVGGLLQIHDVEQGKTLFPAYDGNGNITALLNADTGAVEAAYEYSPFGELLRATGAYAAANPFRFSTKWQDEETGLTYYGYRYYSPREGRFLSRDPAAEQGGLNLYGFCGNDGINAWDYLGQKSWFSKFWNRFRHTVISATLSAIPGAGPILGSLYSTAVGFRSDGPRGAIVALAASALGQQYLGPTLNSAARSYAALQPFRRGNFLENLGDLYAHSVVSHATANLAASAYQGKAPALKLETFIPTSTALRQNYPGALAPLLGALSEVTYASADTLRGVLGGDGQATVSGLQDLGWGALRFLGIDRTFFEPWERPPIAVSPRLPRSLSELMSAVRFLDPMVQNGDYRDPRAWRWNGMHGWHAGSNAAVASVVGLALAPVQWLAGVYHESPLDWLSFRGEQVSQGTVNHVLDSVTDIVANTFGMAVGYALPPGSAVIVATDFGNHIPGPSDGDPGGDGRGGYTGHPLNAWGKYPPIP